MNEKLYYLKIKKRKNHVSDDVENIIFNINNDSQAIGDINQLPKNLEGKIKHSRFRSFTKKLKHFYKINHFLSLKNLPLIYKNYLNKDEEVESQAYSISDEETHRIILSNKYKEETKKSIGNTLKKLKKREHHNTAFYKHRSTWMGVALLFFVLSLAFGSMIPAIIGISIMSATALATLLVDPTIWLANNYDKNQEFNYFPSILKDWIKQNPKQAIIASIGVVLSLIGLTLGVIFFPALIPALTLSCGCSLAFVAVLLMVLGPTTIADIANRYLDRQTLLLADVPNNEWVRGTVTNKIKKESEANDANTSSSIFSPQKEENSDDIKTFLEEGSSKINYKIIFN